MVMELLNNNDFWVGVIVGMAALGASLTVFSAKWRAEFMKGWRGHE